MRSGSQGIPPFGTERQPAVIYLFQAGKVKSTDCQGGTDEVNDSWMTDSDAVFKKVRVDDRLAVPSIKQEKSSLEETSVL